MLFTFSHFVKILKKKKKIGHVWLHTRLKTLLSIFNIKVLYASMNARDWHNFNCIIINKYKNYFLIIGDILTNKFYII